jgi:hypothetical protein
MFKKTPEVMKPKYRVEISVKIVDQSEEDRANQYSSSFRAVPMSMNESFAIKADTFSEIVTILQRFHEAAEAAKK